MKKIKFFAMAAAALLTLGACSEDKIDVPENGGPNNNLSWGESDDAVFFELNINLPSANSSRSKTDDPDENGSSTSTDGVEIGKDYENAVNDVIIVLASPAKIENGINTGYNFIAAAKVNTGDLTATSPDNSTYTILSKFSKTQLSGYYDGDNDLKSNLATVFVFCNPNASVTTAINNAVQGKNDWANAKGKLGNSSPIWTNGSFLMTNSSIAERLLPSKLEYWNYFTNKDKPYKLSDSNDISDDGVSQQYDNSTSAGRGAVRVERVAVRFDFRDGSEDGAKDAHGNVNGIGNFTYHVMFYESFPEGATEPIYTPALDIKLQKMSLVNMNNDYYLLRHVSPTGVPDAAGIVTGVCKPERAWIINSNGGYEENSGNYVVDADYQWKMDTYNYWTKSTPEKPSWNFANNFIYPFFNEDGSIDNTNLINDKWGTSVCSQVVNYGEAQNTAGWTQSNGKEYKIWRYATENTIAQEVEYQIESISTGIVFKGMLQPAENADKIDDPDIQAILDAITGKLNEGGKLDPNNMYANPLLYKFAGKLYPTWPRLEHAALEAAMPTFKWVPTYTDEETGTEVLAHYELETINRSNSVYAAVFGTNGGFGEQEFMLTSMNPETNTPNVRENPETNEKEGYLEAYKITDTRPKVETAANWAWHAWDKAGKPGEGTVKDTFKSAVTSAEITIYQTSVDPSYGVGYYCYYYYWNRHNDNGNNGVMGPMEFATVRNNVYKLAVTKISELGHPRISENDPYKPTPGTPDESQDVYLTVQTEVLPWVVRVNDIQF